MRRNNYHNLKREKFHYKNIPRSNLERIGSVTGLMDKNKNYLLVGDKIECGIYSGRLLYNRFYGCYGIAFGFYNDLDKYNIDSYSKFVAIPNDNGMRMEIKKLEE